MRPTSSRTESRSVANRASARPNTARLLVVISADCDPDRPEYGGEAYSSRALTWRSVEEGIPRAFETCSRMAGDSVGFKINWCIRSDAQMLETYGDAGWQFRNFADLWTSLADEGHELGWHPHLWRWQDGSGWQQELSDEAWVEECMGVGFEGLCDAMGESPGAVRMGWNYHTNLTMNIIDRCRVSVDLSGTPGESSTPYGNRWGGTVQGAYDWETTPEYPYCPSATDYRRPARSGEQALQILELPQSPVHSPTLSALVKLRGAIRKRGQHAVHTRFRHAVRITAHPCIFSSVIRQAVRQVKAAGTGLLAASFHPDELVSRPRDRGLYSHANFEQNLHAIVRTAQREGLTVLPCTAAQAGRLIRERGLAQLSCTEV